MIKVTSSIQVPLEELEFSFARSSGPGGQNVNKVNSKAIMKWRIDEAAFVPSDVIERFKTSYGNQINKDGFVVISSETYRDQHRNIQDCKDKLAAMLKAVALPPKPRKRTKPSKGQIEVRLQQKHQRAEKKQRRQKPDF